MTSNAGNTDLAALAKDLRMLLLDVDGVMTDGGIILIGADQEAKRFNAQDGMGITLARAAGIKVGIVTARSSPMVDRRAKELHIDEVFQGAQRKTEVLDRLMSQYTISSAQVAFIGDHIQDKGIMERVGIAIAVHNAMDVVKECSAYVTNACGGHGAIREAVEWLLELRGGMEDARKAVVG